MLEYTDQLGTITMAKFMLASESPRRANLLRQMGVEFEAIKSGVDEEAVPKASPSIYVKKLARLKARAVANRYPEGIIIGADSVVVLDGRIIGKPRDAVDAKSTLKSLSGKVHKVITGICVINNYSGNTVAKAVVTKVKVKELSDGEIDWYVGTGEPLGKAGSYGIQDRGALFVEWIKGDYYNVTGLPIATLAKMLEEMGVGIKV